MTLSLNKTRGIDYWDKFFELKNIPAELFSFNEKINAEQKKQLFEQFVCIVNLETSTLCNRKCDYCPLSIYDRGDQILMGDELYSQIISDLASISYHSTVSLNLYNEPLLDEKIFLRIQELRKKCPDCFIKFNSNGDYLTREILDKLVESDLNAIFLTLHTPKGKEYNDKDRLSVFEKFFNKLELDYKINEIIPNEKIVSDMNYKGLRLLTEAHNWSEYGNDRGGSIESLSAEVRNTPCVRPIREFTIAFDGRVYPCCQFYPDCESSSKNKIGIISKESNIFDIYTSNLLTNWRKHLFTFGEKTGACSSCKDFDNSKHNTKIIRTNIIKKI